MIYDQKNFESYLMCLLLMSEVDFDDTKLFLNIRFAQTGLGSHQLELDSVWVTLLSIMTSCDHCLTDASSPKRIHTL